MWWRRRKAPQETGPYPGRPNPEPVSDDQWVRVSNGINTTDRINPQYAAWLVGKILENTPRAQFRVFDSHGEDVTGDYR